jgi:hypothetical protein
MTDDKLYSVQLISKNTKNEINIVLCSINVLITLFYDIDQQTQSFSSIHISNQFFFPSNNQLMQLTAVASKKLNIILPFGVATYLSAN